MKKIKGILTATSAFCMLAVAKTSLAIDSGTLPGADEGFTTTHTIESVFTTIIKQALLVLGGIATLMIIYGGFLIIFSEGDEAKQKTGKKLITYAVVGVIVIALAASIVSVAMNLFA
ncbi:hypothetical protein D4R87_02735 [bacterium]|nr:MAG: hypothetical protein D4R87_02735 [bacterium]